MDHNEMMYIPIEETIHVPNDMKMDEMIKISLEPNIIMQMKENFVLLKGDLILQGNYRLSKEELPYERHEPQMEQIQLLGEDKAMFFHAFPIEISIEKTKVKNIDELTMQMEMFDYELLNPVSIAIKANVMIKGITEEEVVVEKEDEDIHVEVGGEFEQAEPVINEPTETLQTEEIEVQEEDNDIAEEEVVIEEEEEIVEASTASFFDLLFTEREETYKKVRMYIAQEDDHLEQIAEKYNISVYQLMQDNELAEDALEVGQILKINKDMKPD